MNFNVPPKALKSIIDRAVKYNVDLVVLFGSRARRAENGRSDVDIAVSGGDFDSFLRRFKRKRRYAPIFRYCKP